MDNEYVRKLVADLLQRVRRMPIDMAIDLPKGVDSESEVFAAACTYLNDKHADEVKVVRNRHHWTLARKGFLQGLNPETADQLRRSELVVPDGATVHAEEPYKVRKKVDDQGNLVLDRNGDPIFEEVYE